MPETSGTRGNRVRRYHRDFTILDAMILIFATAAGFALIRAYGATQYHDYRRDVVVGPWSTVRTVSNAVQVILHDFSCFLTVVTPAIIVLHIRHPRPHWRSTFRGYGAMGCTAALATYPFAMPPEILVSGCYDGWTKGLWHSLAANFIAGNGSYCCFSVLGSWLAVSFGRSARGGGWLEWLGVAVGIGWIGQYGLLYINRVLMELFNQILP